MLVSTYNKIYENKPDMKELKYILCALSVFLCCAMNSYGQGCSDAGLCTISSFKPHSADSPSALENQFKVGAFYGKADNAISVYGSYVEYSRQLSEEFGLNAKLSSLAQSGNGISVFGLSDLFVNANYRTSAGLRVTLGAKVPITQANKTLDNLPLPMDYQASLGTYDVVLGLGYEIAKLQLVAAIQQPLRQNDNRFVATAYTPGSVLRSFPSTNAFERSADVLLRVSYALHLGSGLTCTPSILPIVHLANDKYTNASGDKQEIVGSRGLTLNGNIYIDYELNTHSSLQLNAGMPLIARDARPDGLTRSGIVNLEYRFAF